MNNLPPGTRAIQLTKGKVAIVDEADYPLVSKYRWQASNQWHRKWYAIRSPRTAEKRAGITRVSMHRMILGLTAGQICDHANGDGLDNRRSNLRTCTQSQNMANRHTVQGEVPFRGVDRLGNRYSARIKKNNCQRRLGWFATPQEAARAYDAAALVTFGEFAVTNASMGLLPE